MTPRLCAALSAVVVPPLLLLSLGMGSREGRAGEQTPPPPPISPSSPHILQVVFSTETNGYLTPCGCSAPMIGGFPRRATYLKARAKDGPLVRVDNGDLTQAMGRQDELKAETLVEMLDQLQYDALNVGEKDFRLGVPYLQALQARFKGALLCANARTADGAPLLKEYTVVRREVDGQPVRALVIGLLSDQYGAQITAVNPDVTVEAPEVALERLKPMMEREGDVRVLLYHGPKAEAQALARQFPLFQLVVFGHEGDHPLDPVREGSALLACSGQDGKYLGRARLARAMGWRAEGVDYAELGPDLADDSAILQIKSAYLERVTVEDLLGKVPRVPTASGDTFAGSAACATCHAEPYRIWKESGHARALKALEDVKQDRDPECVACHVVGLDRQGGFVSRDKTPQFENVGCESCHGPAARHARDPSSAKPAKAGATSCQGCHNPQNSPRFDFEKYWPKVRH